MAEARDHLASLDGRDPPSVTEASTLIATANGCLSKGVG